MKRLLVLLLVLCLVSTAGATLKELRVATGITPGVAPDQSAYYDPIDSQVNLLPSDYLWIGVRNMQQGVPGDSGQQSMYLGITANGGGEWTMNWKIYYGEVEPNPPYGDPGYPQFYNEYLGVIPPYGDLWELQMLANLWPIDCVGIGVVDAKEFHCLTDTIDVTVTLLDVEGNLVDSFIIVPEPTTVSLLGLGALGIIGRRKHG